VTPARDHPARRVSFLLALAALLLAGCGTGVDVAADVAPAAGVATAGSAGSGSADPLDRLQGSLLGPRDVGPGWTPDAPPVPDPATPAVCGGPGTVARFPDALRLGSTVDGPPGFVVQEAVSVYRDAATAQAAYTAGVAGLDCRQGTLHQAPVAITPAQDLRADVGGDRAAGWHVTSDALDAELVLVQAREAVFAFAYVAPPGTPATARPDPRALSRVAVARMLAA
jgi:hypothetical protein